MMRLTYRDARGRWTLLLDGKERQGEAVDRLAAYEETGTEPAEIQEVVDLIDRKIPDMDIPAELNRWIERGAWHVRKCEELRKELDGYKTAEKEGRLIVLPCRDDVTLERNGLCFKGDHWNLPTLTAFADDPTTRSGKRVALFYPQEVSAALEERKCE